MSASRGGQHGQVIVLFAFALLTITAMAGLLIDGGIALATQQHAQAAADTAGLAAGSAATTGTDADMRAAARQIAAVNGFPKDLVDCNGQTLPNAGVVINRPPSTGPHSAANDPQASSYVEVVTTRALHTTFAGAVGIDCWLVSARAVSSIGSAGVATCNFCILSDWQTYSTLMLNNDAQMRVDGDIIVNQDNWYYGSSSIDPCGSSPCTAATCSGNTTLPVIRMCGDSIWLAQNNGGNTHLSAKTISSVGGWQTQNSDWMTADQLASNCPYHPEPTAYGSLGIIPTPVANVCLGIPKLADPLNDPARPENYVAPPDPNELTIPVAGQNGCPEGADVPTGTLTSPNRLSLISDNNATHVICPGLYYGGFSVSGDSQSPKVTMLPGIYFIVGGGFRVTGTASIDGSAGVLIYNSSGTESFSSNTLPGIDLVPPCDTASSTCLAPTITGTGNGLSASPSAVGIGETVTYRMRVVAASGHPLPSGTMSFYDGQEALAGCTNLPVVPSTGSTTKVEATCSTSYPLFGERWITGVYSGDAVYAPTGDTFKETIDPPDGEAAANIILDTTTSPCTVQPCGQVILHAPTSGPYAGLLIFQARSAGLGLRIWPAAGAAACTGNWMTDGVPPDTNPVPQPCGALGGLSGTIYAPHQSTGSDDWDAVVNLNASGLANVQFIVAEISLNYAEDARFAYDPTEFANGKIHLVE